MYFIRKSTQSTSFRLLELALFIVFFSYFSLSFSFFFSFSGDKKLMESCVNEWVGDARTNFGKVECNARYVKTHGGGH